MELCRIDQRSPRLTAPAVVTSSATPALACFDLDACLWDQEMFQLSDLPGRCEYGDLRDAGRGVVAVFSGSHRIALHTGALLALQDLHFGVRCPGARAVAASSADTPRAVEIGRCVSVDLSHV
jgi:magnesium-dependent phosphatase 1